ncbi:NUDIX hydrolase [Bradyrhizobium sp. BR 10261]|nr:NUDIX hydrolase [Bradyrhizobium sp. BR 10261]
MPRTSITLSDTSKETCRDGPRSAKDSEGRVSFSRDGPEETYYAIAQPDYVAVLAVTPDSRVPLVRQYRPAIQRFSLELPAGIVDPDEDPLETARRELLEETGYHTVSIERIGQCATCSSRISVTASSILSRSRAFGSALFHQASFAGWSSRASSAS